MQIRPGQLRRGYRRPGRVIADLGNRIVRLPTK